MGGQRSDRSSTSRSDQQLLAAAAPAPPPPCQLAHPASPQPTLPVVAAAQAVPQGEVCFSEAALQQACHRVQQVEVQQAWQRERHKGNARRRRRARGGWGGAAAAGRHAGRNAAG